MKPLTHAEKLERAGRYAILNEILQEKQSICTQISDLMTQVNQLAKRRDELDILFHEKAIELEPTERIDLKRKKPKLPKSAVLDAIIERAKSVDFTPDMLAQLAKVLENDSKGD